ncbi:hypothetical protein [Lysinibacillus xylanilyticus]|uniref:hypothetical protein n=1 Tax=Lysinibacillus xylanilyticus TaxID=582475 RepID=UPI001F333E50|nr:hypothetical protein [Lysinibacillus xylanilyticus]
MSAINNLQLKQIKDITSLNDVDYLINMKLNKEYTLHVYEKKKQIYFIDLSDSTKVDDEYLYNYTILNGDEFFDALKDIIQ